MKIIFSKILFLDLVEQGVGVEGVTDGSTALRKSQQMGRARKKFAYKR